MTIVLFVAVAGASGLAAVGAMLLAGNIEGGAKLGVIALIAAALGASGASGVARLRRDVGARASRPIGEDISTPTSTTTPQNPRFDAFGKAWVAYITILGAGAGYAGGGIGLGVIGALFGLLIGTVSIVFSLEKALEGSRERKRKKAKRR